MKRNKQRYLKNISLIFNIIKLQRMPIILGIFFILFPVICESQNHREDNDKELIIPVVFHVVYNDYSKLGFNTDSLSKILEEINNGFNNVDKTLIDPHYRDLVANCKIIFKLANTDKYCNPIESISWRQTEITSFNDLDFVSRKKLMKYGYLNDDEFLNIWIADFGQRVGYGVYPAGYWIEKLRKDGIAINYLLIKNNIIPPIIHELGHYFNLPHIWEEPMSNNETDTSCNNDDGIDDTPRQAGPNKIDNAGNDGIIQFNELQKVCGDNSTVGNYQNYMDYAYQNPSMFTHGQKRIMRNSILKYRNNLLWKENCNEAPSPTTGFFKDNRNNKSYKWVQIGSQKWMTKNLNYKTKNSTCYNNNESNCTIYGRLYNWNEAMTACPEGWRLPSKKDWDIFLKNTGLNQYHFRSEFGWENNKNGDNSIGINFMPSGFKTNYGKYVGLGKKTKFWLSNSNIFGFSREIGGASGYNKIPQAGASDKKELLACRCILDIKNETPASTEPVGDIKKNVS